MQREVLALQESLFSAQLELQGSQRAERRSQWRAGDVARDRKRLQADLEEALQQQAAAEQHNQVNSLSCCQLLCWGKGTATSGGLSGRNVFTCMY